MALIYAQQGQVVHLTLDSAVDLAMENSYRVQQLKLGIQRSRKWLEAKRASLKSEVSMNVTSPQVEYLSDNKWNSNLQRYELVRENLEVARENLRRYRSGEIAVLDLIQSINGQKETATNFLNAYLGYRQALLSLQQETYYDFEKRTPLLERFHLEGLLN